MKINNVTASKIVLSLAILATILLAYLTHAPMNELKEDFGGIINLLGDKALHLIAYTGVASLYFLYAYLKPLQKKLMIVLVSSLCLFTIADETSQAFVGRTVDVFDLLCNLTGIALGLYASKLLMSPLNRYLIKAIPSRK